MTEHSAAAEPVAAGRWGEVERRLTIALMPIKRVLRSSEIAQIFACALLGVVVGSITAVLRNGVQFFHRVDFALSGSTLLSAGIGVDRFRIVVVPALGGLLLGALALLTRRFRGGDIVDPVEANALYGGRMSLIDSMRLALATFVSNGSGASLGMEAGYTQLGSGIFSGVGGYFNLRRADRRIFVTAGAAAAIAAAFNAPLAGAFYGYELILGGYTLNALAPVAVAAVCGTLAQSALGGDQALFAVSAAQHVDLRSYVIFGAMGVCAAGIGIVAMMCVTWTERGLRRVSVPDWLRPFVGGIVLSAIALYDPQVLGSGHGGIQYHLDIQWPLLPLIVLLFAQVMRK
jgi:CIC family chloride channel protein